MITLSQHRKNPTTRTRKPCRGAALTPMDYRRRRSENLFVANSKNKFWFEVDHMADGPIESLADQHEPVSKEWVSNAPTVGR